MHRDIARALVGLSIILLAPSSLAQSTVELGGSISVAEGDMGIEGISVSENQGSVTYSEGGGIDKGIADARCSQGSLLVSEVESDRYSNAPFGPGNYHVYDYSFYYLSVRLNAQQRVASYWSANAVETR